MSLCAPEKSGTGRDFTGTRGEQIASRIATIPTKSFAYGTRPSGRPGLC